MDIRDRYILLLREKRFLDQLINFSVSHWDLVIMYINMYIS